MKASANTFGATIYMIIDLYQPVDKRFQIWQKGSRFSTENGKGAYLTHVLERWPDVTVVSSNIKSFTIGVLFTSPYLIE